MKKIFFKWSLLKSSMSFGEKVIFPRRGSIGGFTLIEVMIAMAIFMVVMGATAQGFVSSFAIARLQDERMAAAHDCKAVLSTLRQMAYNPTANTECPQGTILFPCVLMTWVDNFPGTRYDAEGDPDLWDIYGVFFSLPEQTIEIEVRDEDGNIAVTNATVASDNTNPIFVTVRTTWRGVGNHIYPYELNTVLTNR